MFLTILRLESLYKLNCFTLIAIVYMNFVNCEISFEKLDYL
jgi:hypothetical protein